MKNLLQTFVSALIFGLLVYFLFVVYDKNKDRIGWGETNEKLTKEAETVSENVDKGVRKAKKIYEKVKKEVNEENGNGATPSPDGLSGADKSTPNPPATKTTPPPPEGTLIPETVITPTNNPPQQTPPVNPNDTTPYDIQLALVKNSAYNPETWQSLSDLGTLTVQAAPNNRKRVILGTYYGRARAEEILGAVKQRGFTDAFLLAGGKANTVNLPQINFNKRRLTSNSYIIQLAAMRNPQSKKFKDFTKLGNLYFEYAADLDITKIIIGPYQNETEAAQALQEVKTKGYPRAFTRRLTVHEVANMEQVVF
ncbi:SPOR domain-containing protein [Sphingobacteriales bacterium UPWRP_1]|nr:hypothetical protein BVG80_00405 [Sphingobacteriales bacterium TSM_CSM]PSJ72008.1 SPOR domain-containing protein [Sphingobacteriales bacterium UPWRP_1]